MSVPFTASERRSWHAQPALRATSTLTVSSNHVDERAQLPLFLNEPVQEWSPEPATIDADPSRAKEPVGPDEAEMAGLVATAVAEMRAAKGDSSRERAAVCRWFKRGLNAEFSTEKLVDVFGVSSDVLDGAGYNDDDAQRVMDESVDGSSDDEVEQAALED